MGDFLLCSFELFGGRLHINYLYPFAKMSAESVISANAEVHKVRVLTVMCGGG